MLAIAPFQSLWVNLSAYRADLPDAGMDIYGPCPPETEQLGRDARGYLVLNRDTNRANKRVGLSHGYQIKTGIV